ncbi:hypothetical protein CH289_07690 [Rhodococcus sp. RS1C4]|nr:hypothetical protein CH289_07690 [Rhodococcus sp. RS1C4]
MMAKPYQTLSTHVTRYRRPPRLVAEIRPGIFAIQGGSVKSADVAVHLYERQDEDDRQMMTISVRQQERADRIEAARDDT